MNAQLIFPEKHKLWDMYNSIIASVPVCVVVIK